MDVYQTNLFDITKDEYFSPKSPLSHIWLFVKRYVCIYYTRDKAYLYIYPEGAGRARVDRTSLIKNSPSISINT